MNKVIYRQAAGKDILQIIELWREFIDFHKVRDSFYSRSKDGPENFGKFILENLHKEDAVVYVAETKGRVVAYMLATIQNYPPAFEITRYGLINDLAVTAKYRRVGIGEHILEMAKNWFEKKAIKRIEAEVVIANEISTSFWAKIGFKPYKEIFFAEI